eukprot:3073838-Alexandrium_andersonii.AAC.1
MQDAGSGTDRPNMRVISELSRQIWEQTESAVMSELQLEDPEVAVPAPYTYRVVHWPPVRGAEGQPDGHINVRFQPRDMLE